jgi:hypothetical protein
MYRLFIFSFFIGTVAITFKKDRAEPFLNKKIYELKAGATTMEICSDGGRIVSFRLGNIEMITNKNEHENFGSTLWTAPQRDWGWPPYATLDSEEYQVEKTGDTLKMISSPDLKSGLQFEKTFLTINNQYIRVEYVIRNISGIEKKLGAWEVTRVPCGGLAFFHAGGKGKVPKSSLQIDLLQDSVNWVMIDKKPITKHQKLFATAGQGWIGYAVNNVLFVKQFPDTRPEDYSPEQGEVEIYTDKEKSYTELENQGPYRLLQPGQSLNYIVNWQLIAIPKIVESEKANKKLCSFAGKQVNQIINSENKLKEIK